VNYWHGFIRRIADPDEGQPADDFSIENSKEDDQLHWERESIPRQSRNTDEFHLPRLIAPCA
jgi:hypothetical protein